MKNFTKYLLIIICVLLITKNSIPSLPSKYITDNINVDTTQIDSIYTIYKEKLDAYNYTLNYNLPLISIPEYDSTFTTANNKIDIKVILSSRIKYANIYLYINKQKVDLYYKVNGDEYTFRNVRLFAGKNDVEIFYTIGTTRSNSSEILINKE